MSVSVGEIQRRFQELVSDLMGRSDTQIGQVAIPEKATPDSIVFVTEQKFLDQALASPAGCLVLHLKAKPVIEKLQPSDRSVLFSRNVKLAMALIKQEYFAVEIPLQKPGTIHSTAIIDASATLGKGVSVGAYSVIGQNVVIGDSVRIDASVIIEADAKVGKNSQLLSHLYIGPRTEIGERCLLMPHSSIGAEGFGSAPDENGKFHRIPQTGKVVLENEVEVGSMTTIDRATLGVTLIGEGTKIDKHAHIAHNCVIGKHCVLAGKFAVAGSATIGNHFIAGGRVTVKDGVTIADRVEVAGLAGVHGSITESGQYGGFPIQPVRDAMRSGMSLAHLPQMRKDISKILKHLQLDDSSSDAST
jgi:UDP-3-O-[3-hydroxymyristoyl] glucosamine N-acyltransferase